jgi:hypothetical protein
MANIRDQDVDLARQNEQRPVLDQDLGEIPRNNVAREEGINLSVCLIRVFIWTCVFMVAATNSLTAAVYYDITVIRVCSNWLALNNYVFCGAMTFLYLIGFHEYYLMGCFITKQIPKRKASNLIKFTLLAPVVSFLSFSDYLETKLDCRPIKNLKYIVNQLFTATSMILVVFASLFILATLYQIWVESQKNSKIQSLKNENFKRDFKECLDLVTSSKGIDKFKKFASEMKALGLGLHFSTLEENTESGRSQEVRKSSLRPLLREL